LTQAREEMPREAQHDALEEQAAKRQRASSLGLLPSTAPPGLRPSALPAPPPPRPLAPEDGADDEDPAARPDVFEYFAQRAGRQRELEEQVRRLQQREAVLERRLQDAETKAARVAGDAEFASARGQAAEAQLQLQVDQLQEALRREVERGAVLQGRAGQAAAAAAAAQSAAPAAGTPGLSLGAGAAEARSLQLRVSGLERALQAARHDAEQAARLAAVQLATERQRRSAEAAAAAVLQQQVEDAEAAAEEAAASRRALEEACALLEQRAAAPAAGAAGARPSEGLDVLVRSLREQLAAAQAEAADARRLREQASNAHVLRERLEAAEARARRAEALLEGGEAAHGALAQAQQELRRWTVILEGAADCAAPEDVLHLMRRLQDGQAAAVAAAGARADAEAALRADADAAREAAAAAAADAQAAAARAEAADAALARADRVAALLSRERDSLKAVLASYDEEYLAQHGAEITPQQRRIAELEATVEALHAHTRALEADAGAAAAAAARGGEAEAAAAARADAAEGRVRGLEAEAANLRRQVALLTERVGRGEFNPDTTRVLHLRANPEAELARAGRDARVAELESENDALRHNIQRMEAAAGGGGAAGAGGGGGAPAAGAPSGLRVAQLEGEASLLRRRVAEAQKASDRLQQVFTRQIGTFREAVLGLFGYRVEMTTDPAARECRAQFVLRPAAADEAGAELAFRMLRDGRLVLAPTEYSGRRLAREVETFVDRFHSIPAFTANLTMENFQRQTQG
jgi:mitotic spindle assembly checkpoint protein MAD1